MHRERNPNLQILEMVVEQLGPLADDMVFLGGCATGLLLTDVAAPPIRVTQDVDVITEVASLGDYQRLSGQLRRRAGQLKISIDRQCVEAIHPNKLVNRIQLQS